MIETLRALRRLLVAVPITAIAFSWASAASLLLSPWPRTRVRQQGRAFRFWCRGLCRALGVRVRVEGRAPEPPFVLVSNHLSYLDILVLGTELRCVFVAKAEIDRWPVFGALCRSVATIFIDRRAKRELHRILAEMETTLAAGQGIVIFPEGTSSAGHDVLAFRSPLLDLPVRLGRPVHWATLGYRVPPGAPPAHLVVAWWADMPFGPHVRALLRLEWIEATLRLGGAPIAAEDRKHLAERLRAEVVARFEPMVAAGEVERLLALRESDPVALPAALAGGAGRRRGAPS